MRRLRVLLSSITLALALLPAGAVVALGDEDPPIRPEIGDPRVRPPHSALRDTTALPPATGPERSRRQLILVVGGYGSEYRNPRPLHDFADQLRTGCDCDIVYFGSDPRFPYDTLGSIDQSAVNLIAQIRSLSPGYDGIHIVAHSMGGAVTDQAFAHGLSASDGVHTYVALSVPHSGSNAAAISQFALDHVGPARTDVNTVARITTFEADTPAARDLAHLRPVGAPAGVTRLDLRFATDVVVSGADTRDPGVTSRTLIPPPGVAWIDGHTGILSDQRALEMTRETIRTGLVPPAPQDRASAALTSAIAQHYDRVGIAMLVALCGLCVWAGVERYLRRKTFPILA